MIFPTARFINAAQRLALLALLGVVHLRAIELDPRTVGSWPSDGLIGRRPLMNIAISGSDAYLAYADFGLVIVDISAPEQRRPIGKLRLVDVNLRSIEGIAVSGNFAYLSGLGGLAIVDVRQPAYPQLAGRLSIDPGGARNLIVQGHYVFWGKQIIDVRDPAKPMAIGQFKVAPNGVSDVAVNGSRAYIAEPFGGVTIHDVSDPTNPTPLGKYSVSRNLSAVAVRDRFLFLLSYDGVLEAIDVSDAAHPSSVGNAMISGHQTWSLAVSGDWLFVTAYDGGVIVFDISDPAQPRQISNFDTPGEAIGVTAAGSTAYVADGHVGMQIIDFSDPANPRRLGGDDPRGRSQSVMIKGNDAYVAETIYLNGTPWGAGVMSPGGLQVVDISSASNPRALGRAAGFDAYDVAVTGSHAYLAAGEQGIVTVDIADSLKPKRVATTPISGFAQKISVAGKSCYVLSSAWDATPGGFHIVDLSVPGDPVRIGGVAIPARDFCVVSNQVAYLAAETRGIVVVDLTNAANPQTGVELPLDGSVMTVAAGGGYLYAVASTNLVILDIADPQRPKVVRRQPTQLNGTGLRVTDQFAFGLDGSVGEIFDLSNRTMPVSVGRFWMEYPGRFDASRGHLYLPQWEAGLQVIDLTVPTYPRVVSRFPAERALLTLDAARSRTFSYEIDASEEAAELQVINFENPSAPQKVGSLKLMDLPLATAISGRYLFTISGNGVEVADVGDDTAPRQLSGWPSAGGRIVKAAATISGNFFYGAYTFDDDNGRASLECVDISDPSNPKMAGTLTGRWDAWDIAVAKDLAYIAGGRFDFHVIDISTRANMKEVSTLALNAISVAVGDRHGFVADGNGFIVVLDLLGNVRPVANLALRTKQVRLLEPFLYAASDIGLSVIDVADPANSRLVSGNGSFEAGAMAVTPSQIFVAGRNELLALDQVHLVHLEPLTDSNKTFTFRLHGIPQTTWKIQRSADLRTWDDWQSVTIQEAPLLLTDPSGSPGGRMFYRAGE